MEHWWNDTDRRGTFPSAADLMWTHLGTNLSSVETGWQLTRPYPWHSLWWILSGFH